MWLSNFPIYNPIAAAPHWTVSSASLIELTAWHPFSFKPPYNFSIFITTLSKSFSLRFPYQYFCVVLTPLNNIRWSNINLFCMFYPLFQIKQIRNWALYFPNLFDVSETTGNCREHNISHVFNSVDFWAKKIIFTNMWKRIGYWLEGPGFIYWQWEGVFLLS
jgi:hypothetical protein